MPPPWTTRVLAPVPAGRAEDERVEGPRKGVFVVVEVKSVRLQVAVPAAAVPPAPSPPLEIPREKVPRCPGAETGSKPSTGFMPKDVGAWQFEASRCIKTKQKLQTD